MHNAQCTMGGVRMQAFGIAVISQFFLSKAKPPVMRKRQSSADSVSNPKKLPIALSTLCFCYHCAFCTVHCAFKNGLLPEHQLRRQTAFSFPYRRPPPKPPPRPPRLPPPKLPPRPPRPPPPKPPELPRLEGREAGRLTGREPPRLTGRLGALRRGAARRAGALPGPGPPPG